MRLAVLVSAPLDTGLPEKILADKHPRQDCMALAEVLGGQLIAPFLGAPGHSSKAYRAANIFRSAWAAYRRHGQYDLIISDMDRVGLTLALLFKLTGTRKRHILICHGKLALSYDLSLLRKLNLQEYIDRFVCYGPAIASQLRNELDIPDYRVVTVRHAADHQFWRPQRVTPEKLIVSAGMLHRDYSTLVEAVKGKDLPLIIAAHSPWMARQKNGISPESLPDNVSITRCDYFQLRELYSRALCVAVPLIRSDSQSGSLVLYEAMAMGKPVLVTRTTGQAGLDIIQEGETGFYLEPGDVDGWRRRIEYLDANPQVAIKMGRRAREAVEDGMNLDSYLDDMLNIIHTVVSGDHSSGLSSREVAAPM